MKKKKENKNPFHAKRGECSPAILGALVPFLSSSPFPPHQRQGPTAVVVASPHPAQSSSSSSSSVLLPGVSFLPPWHFVPLLPGVSFPSFRSPSPPPPPPCEQLLAAAAVGTGSCQSSCSRRPGWLSLHCPRPLVPVVICPLVVGIGVIPWFCWHGSTSFSLL